MALGADDDQRCNHDTEALDGPVEGHPDEGLGKTEPQRARDSRYRQNQNQEQGSGDDQQLGTPVTTIEKSADRDEERGPKAIAELEVVKGCCAPIKRQQRGWKGGADFAE